MKFNNLSILSFCILVIACGSSDSYSKAEDATDAGREFVRGFLDGNHKKAFYYMLKDSTNEMLFDTQKEDYMRLSKEGKTEFRESSIHPVSIIPINDSVTTFRYFHSARPKDTTDLRMVKWNGEWLVDLKSVIKM